MKEGWKISGVLLLFSLMVSSSCSSEPEEMVTAPSDFQLEVKILDENSDAISGIKVYSYLSEADFTSGNLHSVETSDSDGIVTFTVDHDISSVYVNVVEKLISLEENILGEKTITLPSSSDTPILEELQISNRQLVYPFGFVPNTIDSELARSEYERWKNTQLSICNGNIRIIADPASNSLVEAVGFGTLVSAYAGDKETFDGLMGFYDEKVSETANGMMAWSVTCDGVNDPGSATDGDIDVAFANIVAYQQWGGNYLDRAKEIIAVLRNSVFTTCEVNGQTVNVIYPGYSGGPWGGCGMTDIMYYTSGFFRVFAEVTGDNIWNELADDTYVLLAASAHPTTGLVPDWQTAAGSPGPGDRNGHFGYDACRAPWRMSLDYLWNGNQEAKAWCTKVSNWAYEVGADNLVDGYELDGTPRGEYGVNSAFLGGFSVAMMTHSQEKSNNFATAMSELNDTYWFNLDTRIVYLFAMTGNFWKPEIQD